MVDDDLRALFSEDEETLRRAVPEIIRRSQEDPDVEERLIDLLETFLEEGNDDTNGSVMAVIVLGESGSQRGVGVLLRCLESEADESLQDAALVALLRLGPAAVQKVMEQVDEEESPAFNRAAYRLLGMIGVLEDERLTEGVKDFLDGRAERERHKPRSESAIEDLLRASAHLGDRRQIETVRRILTEDYKNQHPGLRDALEILEENVDGVPFVATVPPWEERYGWLFADEREEARVTRSKSGEISLSFGDLVEEEKPEEEE